MSQQKKIVHVRDRQMAFPSFNAFWINDVNPVSGVRKTRRINDPNSSMRLVHEGLIHYLRHRIRLEMASATAARQGDSALNNVLRHRKQNKRRKGFNRFLVLLDISSAYPSVNMEKLIESLIAVSPRLAGREEELRQFLLQYCFDPKLGGLVTGAPSSPDFFNLYCEVQIDRELRRLCELCGITYTRYIDDLTFSSTRPIGLKKRRRFREVLTKAGFKISDWKARVYDLKKGPVTINGVGVCLDGRLFLPRHTLNHIRGLLHTAVYKGGISPNLIHGKMGLLKSLTKPATANATELKVFRLYEQFCVMDRSRRETLRPKKKNNGK